MKEPYIVKSVVKKGHSLYVNIDPRVLVPLAWRRGHKLMLIVRGDTLVMRRLKLDQLAMDFLAEVERNERGANVEVETEGQKGKREKRRRFREQNPPASRPVAGTD